MSLPDSIIAVLLPFAPEFTRPTWQHALVLVAGTLLACGRRTVAAALRATGHTHDPLYSRYHQVLNRAQWSPLAVSRRLLRQLVAAFAAPDGPLTLVIDETLERRWGPQIRQRGHWRDPRRSSRTRHQSNSGLRWLTVMLVVNVPWTDRAWALPFLSVLLTTPAGSRRLGRRHQTGPERAAQVVRVLRRWLPGVPIVLVGDGAYSKVALGRLCVAQQVTLVAPLRLDACLYGPPLPRRPGQRGAPARKGPRLPQLAHLATAPPDAWQPVEVRWYDGLLRRVEVQTGTALWYRSGVGELALRWVLVRDPQSTQPVKAYFSTDPALAAEQIVAYYVQRWTCEVTYEEARAHLGVETQRQWSLRAIARSTPGLFGLYSVVALVGQQLHAAGRLGVQQAAWYRKPQATFRDVLGAVRQEVWGVANWNTSPSDPDMVLIPRATLERLLYTACYSG